MYAFISRCTNGKTLKIPQVESYVMVGVLMDFCGELLLLSTKGRDCKNKIKN